MDHLFQIFQEKVMKADWDSTFSEKSTSSAISFISNPLSRKSDTVTSYKLYTISFSFHIKKIYHKETVGILLRIPTLIFIKL